MHKRSVGLLDTQPLFAEGVKSTLAGSGEFQNVWAVSSIPLGLEMARHQCADLVLLDKSFGFSAILSAVEGLRHSSPQCTVVVWGAAMAEAEALRLLQIGVRGLLRRSADPGTLMDCLRRVAVGGRWMEDCVFREGAASDRAVHSDLTQREQQVLHLVQQGKKNREIANELGIRPGTVKIHLKHIFEKTGIHGRYGLALDQIRIAQPESIAEPGSEVLAGVAHA